MVSSPHIPGPYFLGGWLNDPDLRGPWGPAAGPQSLSSLKKELSKETEIMKQIKCLLEAKYVWKNTQADSE